MKLMTQKPKLSALTIRRLRRVVAHILEEPRRFDMNEGFGKCPADDDNAPACGTVGCIAGWGWALQRSQKERLSHINPSNTHVLWWEVLGDARAYFRLDEEQAHRLFQTAYWPPKFQDRLFPLPARTKKYAQVMQARVEHFIRTGGAE